MSRPILTPTALSAEALQSINSFHPEVIKEVSEAVAKFPVVVVGMAQNIFVKKAKRALDGAGIKYTYLEYGNYMSKWKQRLAIKLWSGWPTFPQVYVQGVLIGGASDTVRALANGSLKKRLEK